MSKEPNKTQTQQELDEHFMRQAIIMAKRAAGSTSPNPPVGAVITRNNRIIAKAATGKGGSPHAEFAAIEAAQSFLNSESLSDCVLYVTLEPCNFVGKNPSCQDAITKANIKKIFIANSDPNPKVSGKSTMQLENYGVEVISSFLAHEAMREVNLPYFLARVKRRPYIILKAAVTMDGKIALANGVKSWISGTKATDYSHFLRYKNDGIMVGVNTVIWDNPRLTCRLRGLSEFSPKRIILDSNAKTPPTSFVVKDKTAETIIYSNQSYKMADVNAFEVKSSSGNYLNLEDVLQNIAAKGMFRIVVEGGAHLSASLLTMGVVDEIHVIKSPKIFGESGLSFLGSIDLKETTRSLYVTENSVKMGEDVAIFFKNRKTAEMAAVLK